MPAAHTHQQFRPFESSYIFPGLPKGVIIEVLKLDTGATPLETTTPRAFTAKCKLTSERLSDYSDYSAIKQKLYLLTLFCWEWVLLLSLSLLQLRLVEAGDLGDVWSVTHGE